MKRNFSSRNGSLRTRGFTLVEMIAVIVVISILAVTALPKMLDLTSDASTGAMSGVLAAVNTAHSLNHAGCVATRNAVTPGKCVKVSNCSDTASLLQGGVLPSGYTIAAASLGTVNGTEGTCSITQTSSSVSQNFAGIAAGN